MRTSRQPGATAARRGVPAAEAGKPPTCDCGCGLPMRWNKNAECTAGGRWRCLKRSREATHQWLNATRRVVVEERERRGGACERCNSKGPLHWHHRIPEEKRFRISNVGAVPTTAALIEELAACDLLCAACHAAEHKRMRSAATGARGRVSHSAARRVPA